MINNLQRNYTRIIGVVFILVAVALIFDFIKHGNTPEAWHKLFLVFLGTIIVKYGWGNRAFWKPFCLGNGLFFLFAAAFGFTFPDFAQLSAFSTLDTSLYAIIGILGIGAYLTDKITV